jgi:hypothetical protein
MPAVNLLPRAGFPACVPVLIYFLYSENKTCIFASMPRPVGKGTGNRRCDLSVTGAL